MWAQRDEFQFVWKRMTGDFILQARVELLGKGVDPHRKAGWMIRPTLDADAPYVDGVVHGDGLTSLQFRRTKGAITEQNEMPAVKGADVIQLERKGGTYIFSAAKFGEPFTTAEVADVDSRRRGATSGSRCARTTRTSTERAIFRDVRIIRPAKDGFVPYRDFIGSVLEILDVRDRAPADRPQLGAAVRGAQLDARRRRAHLQPERPRGRVGRPVSLRSRHAAVRR